MKRRSVRSQPSEPVKRDGTIDPLGLVPWPGYVFCPPETSAAPDFTFFCNAPSEEDMSNPKKVAAWFLLAKREQTAWMKRMLEECVPDVLAQGDTGAAFVLGGKLERESEKLRRANLRLFTSLA